MGAMKNLFIEDMDKAMEVIKDYSTILDTIKKWVGTEFTAEDVFNDYDTNYDIFTVVFEMVDDTISLEDAYGRGGVEVYTQELIEAVHDDIIDYIDELITEYVESF